MQAPHIVVCDSIFRISFEVKNMTLGLGQQHKVLRFDRKTDGPFSKSGLIIPFMFNGSMAQLVQATSRVTQKWDHFDDYL